MAWLRIDDQFGDHPKVMACGPLAAFLDVAAMAYCSKHLTDGFVPAGAVPKLINLTGIESGGTPVTTDELVATLTSSHGPLGPRWTVVDGGFQIHDYLEYNPSREEVEKKRNADATRQRDHRQKGSTQGASETCHTPVTALVTPESRRDTPGSHAVSHAVSHAPVTHSPFPIPKEEKKEALNPTQSPTQEQLPTAVENSQPARASPASGWEDQELLQALGAAVQEVRVACPQHWAQVEHLLRGWRRELRPLEVCVRCLRQVAAHKPDKPVGYAVKIMKVEEGNYHAGKHTAELKAAREEERKAPPPTIEVTNRAPAHVSTEVQSLVARLIESAKDQGRMCPEKVG